MQSDSITGGACGVRKLGLPCKQPLPDRPTNLRTPHADLVFELGLAVSLQSGAAMGQQMYCRRKHGSLALAVHTWYTYSVCSS
jgi:hypothetical protein